MTQTEVNGHGPLRGVRVVELGYGRADIDVLLATGAIAGGDKAT
jgi:hypothetical protein